MSAITNIELCIFCRPLASAAVYLESRGWTPITITDDRGYFAIHNTSDLYGFRIEAPGLSSNNLQRWIPFSNSNWKKRKSKDNTVKMDRNDGNVYQHQALKC